MNTTTETPRIYVASLSDYNAGRMLGAWVDITGDPDDTHEAIAAILATSQEPGAEEWAIHDHDGWAPMNISESADVEALNVIAAGIIDYGPAFAAWSDYYHGPHPVAADIDPDEFDEDFRGEWESVEAYAEDLFEELGIYAAIEEAAGTLAPYCQPDAAMLARELQFGDIFTAENPAGGVWIFQQR